MKQTWKITLEYDGGRYSGWQEQTNARTVMGEVRKAASEFLRGELDLQGSGRTDAGVHAYGQVMHLRAVHPRPPAAPEILRRLNENLPADIAVLAVEEAHPRFHARHDAIARRYLYRIATRKMAFAKKYVWWVKQPLDVETMAEAAEKLAGRHDFIAFRAADAARPDESTIVVVDYASVTPQDGQILFRIEASHFLWRMVRRLVGTIVKLGAGEITMADFDYLLSGRQHPRLDVAAWTAPSSGLFLEEVRYSAERRSEVRGPHRPARRR